MKIDVDGKLLIKSASLFLKATGVVVFSFDEGSRITLNFRSNKNTNEGKRSISNEIDDDGKGMTLHCNNFDAYVPLQEGFLDEPVQIFSHGGKNYYLSFSTTLLNDERRSLTISFLKDK
ncbi:TPA: hypothetical protein OTY99_003097 [Citrobacter freundii]|nr:hypothetical protein [Citrobacter freundii]HEI8703818.1 hypothetical protein [Citrobacter freundii]